MTAIVRVSTKSGNYHEDVGCGSVENFPNKAAALEKCKKEATTDALKRALRWYGNQMGNCLYDKTFLKHIGKVKGAEVKFVEAELYRHSSFTSCAPAKPSLATKTDTLPIPQEEHPAAQRQHKVEDSEQQHQLGNDSVITVYSDIYGGDEVDEIFNENREAFLMLDADDRVLEPSDEQKPGATTESYSYAERQRQLADLQNEQLNQHISTSTPPNQTSSTTDMPTFVSARNYKEAQAAAQGTPVHLQNIKFEPAKAFSPSMANKLRLPSHNVSRAITREIAESLQGAPSPTPPPPPTTTTTTTTPARHYHTRQQTDGEKENPAQSKSPAHSNFTVPHGSRLVGMPLQSEAALLTKRPLAESTERLNNSGGAYENSKRVRY